MFILFYTEKNFEPWKILNYYVLIYKNQEELKMLSEKSFKKSILEWDTEGHFFCLL